MEFRILGPLEVVSADGGPLDLGPPQQRAVLTLLVLHANRVVTTDRILEELWGADAHGKENALWVYISKLRSALEPPRDTGQSSVLVTRDHGYELIVEPDSIDAEVFERRVGDARSLSRDDPATASELLASALAMWRGAALENVADRDFAQIDIARLEALRLTALEERIEADLRRGRAAELVSELTALCAAESLHEGFVRQLMLALYQSGRPADALRAFDSFRRHVDAELGIVPSPELSRLEEQVLLHDQALARTAPSGPSGQAGGLAPNPYKGLRAFGEDDQADFFGRDRLVAEVVGRIRTGERLIALVGPSGSGKSSVVRAGVIPALRKNVVEGSDRWVVAQMVPGNWPFAELETALLRASLDAPDSLAAQLAEPNDGMLRAVLRVLGDDEGHLLLVIDQFEELFTLLTSESDRQRFIHGLLTLVNDPRGRVTVVLTLRADLYDRPLHYPELAESLGPAVVTVPPLAPEELEQAAHLPAERAGVALGSGLIARLLSDVIGRPGSLPLFQYTLTELFTRRESETLTLESYDAMRGIDGAVAARADDLYEGLGPEVQAVARQLMLRLVIVDGEMVGRRRVEASELLALDIEPVAVQTVVERFSAHRLLTLDRNHRTGTPTVEVAHEALLTAWGRLVTWIDDSHEDLARLEVLQRATSDWIGADHHPDYLLTGIRLTEAEAWARSSDILLTADQCGFIEAGVRLRDDRDRVERDRADREERSARLARRRLWGMAASITVLAGIVVAWILLAGEEDPWRVAVAMTEGVLDANHHGRAGLAQAESELGVDVDELYDVDNSPLRYRDLAEAGTDLVFMEPYGSAFPWATQLAAEFPQTTFVSLDGWTAPGMHSVHVSETEVGFLAGVTAATTTETGVVGYLGGAQVHWSEAVRAGFEAGVATVDPSARVVATHVAHFTDAAYAQPDHATVRSASALVFEEGVDVLYVDASFVDFEAIPDIVATTAAIEAAAEETRRTGVHRWVIGSRRDGSSLERPDARTPRSAREHLLTEIVRWTDLAMFRTIEAHLDGTLPDETLRFGIDDGAITLAPSSNLGPDELDLVEQMTETLATGMSQPSTSPGGELLAAPRFRDASRATVRWDGDDCSFDGETVYGQGRSMAIRFENAGATSRGFFVGGLNGAGIMVDTHVAPGGVGHGFLMLPALGKAHVYCVPLVDGMIDVASFEPGRADQAAVLAIAIG